MLNVKKVILIVIAISTLSACTMRTAYNYLDWYLAWQIDDYVELTSEQEELFDRAVDNFIAWHRVQELPKYRKMLTELKSSVEKQDSSTLTQVFNNADRVWLDSAQEVAPSIILLLEKLTMAQRQELVKNIKAKQQEDHKKWREQAKRSAEERVEEEVEELTETLGELTAKQKEAYLVTLDSFSSTREMRIKSREIWMNKFETALTASQNVDQITLYELFTDMSSYRSEEHMSTSQANEQIYLAFLTKNLPTLTTKQQKHIIGNIQEYLDDLDYLIAQKS